MSKINADNKPIVQDIQPKDDAFHGPTKYVGTEWWYFDAIFDNSYSAVISLTKSSKKNLLTFPTIEIYKNGELEVRAIKRYIFQDFQISQQTPFVKLFNDKGIEFDQDRFNDRGEWIYNISLKIDDHEITLTFIGTTKGWKIKSKTVGSWTVALPKASVAGDIVVHGNRMKVKGIGYHDHNWISGNLLTFVNLRCWYWGKILGKTLNVVWANVINTSSEEELLAVVNQDNQGYFAINPKNIHFNADKFIRNYGRKMPTSFTLQIDDIVNDIPIHVDIKMDVKGIHRRYKRMLISPYWRYHVKANGIISLGSVRETINSTQIMEFFRSI